MGPVLLETEPRSGPPLDWAPTMRGVDPDAETNVSKLPTSVVEGQFDLSGRGMLVGSVLAGKLDVQVGDKVAIYSARHLKKDQAIGKGEEVPLADEYEVRGIFDVGYYEFNAGFVVVSLENAQDMYELDDGDVSGPHGDAARSVHALQPNRANWRRTLGPQFKVVTWLEQSSLLAAVLVEKNVMLYILFFIVLVAAFGITCTLITFIVMKTREIGLMKAHRRQQSAGDVGFPRTKPDRERARRALRTGPRAAGARLPQ